MKLKSFPTALIAAGILALIAAACTGGPGPDPGDPINPDIVPICCKEGQAGDYVMGAWATRNEIYTAAPLSYLRLGDDFTVAQDSVIILEGYQLYVESNEVGTELLFIRSLYRGALLGTLLEMDLQTSQVRTFRDSSYAVSSAVYLPGSDASKVIYYSYGNADKNLKAGYYLFDKDTGRDSLLFAHRSALGPDEVVNGFDVSPDSSTLLYPAHYRSRPPEAVEYNLKTGTRDTLDLDFEHQLLWLRYSPDGSRLLYCNYPVGAFGPTVHDTSEIGIIELPAEGKRVLNADTNPDGPSVQIAPRWSPNGQHIVYGSAPGPAKEPPGAKGFFSLYVLKNVN